MQYDVCIIGAGPAGIEAALQAQAKGLSFALLERFEAGSYIDQTMRNKKFYHVYGTNTAPHTGLLAFPDRVKGYELVDLWKAQAAALNYRPHTLVSGIRKEANGFVVAASNGDIEAKSVILASGTFESRKRLGVDGEDENQKIHYEYDYYTDYEDEQIIIVGGGNSALEAVIGIVEGGVNNTVTLLVRKPTLHESVTDRNKDTLAEFVASGDVTVHYEATVQSLTQDEVTVLVAGIEQKLPYDRLFVNIGFEKPTGFLESLGIRVVEERADYDLITFETNVPGLYVVGTLTGADSVIEASQQAEKIIASMAETRTRGEYAAAGSAR